jgi:outer membrane biosynthesis protein TonB
MFQRICRVCYLTALAALLVGLFLALASAGPVAVQALPLQTPTERSHESLTPRPPLTPVPTDEGPTPTSIPTTPPPPPEDKPKSASSSTPTPTPIPLLPSTGGPSDGSPVVWLPCLLALLSLVGISGLVLRRRSP